MRLPTLARSLVLSSGVTLLALGVAVASNPSLKVSPGKVKIGGMVSVRASHLPAGKYFYLLLAVPDATHPKASSFVPSVLKSASNGTLTARIHLPLVTACGRATLYAYQAKSKVGVATHLTLTGCKASGKTPPPPTKPVKVGKGGKTPPPPPAP